MKKQLLAGVLSATMVMASMPTTAMAVDAPEKATNSLPGSTIVSEQEVPENESVEQPAEIESIPASEIQEIAETHEASDGVFEVDSVETLRQAVEAAEDGVETTIRLTQDISDMTTAQIITIPEDKNIVLDMNGRSITVDGNDFSGRPIVNNGTLTVTGNGTIDSSMANSAKANTVGFGAIDNFGTLLIENGVYKGSVFGGAAIRNKEGASLTIEDGYFESNSAIYNFEDATAVINGGEFKSEACNAIKDDTGKGNYYAYAFISAGNLYFNEGKVTGVQGALAINNGYAEVKNGTFETVLCEHATNAAFYSLYIAGERGVVNAIISGGNFKSATRVAVNVGNDNTGGDGGLNLPANATITGGTFIGGGAGTAALEAPKTGTLNITGGAFSSDVTAYVDPSSDMKQDENGQWVATPIPASEGVAAIGDKYYRTLADAVNAVTPGGTITILNDVNEAPGISVPSGKKFTIDFDDHTYTLSNPGAGSTGTETNGFQLLQGSDITFKNGTIRISDKNGSVGPGNPIKRIIQNYANLTLENMRIYAKNQSPDENYALSFNCGNIVFKGDTSIYVTDPENTIVFDICKYSSYPSVAVVFDESYTGTIQGTIVYDSSDSETHTLEIKGNGTFGKIEATSTSTDAAKDAITVYSGHYAESVKPDYLDESLNTELKSASNTKAPYSYYDTVDEAIRAAEPGDTITVIKDDGVPQSYTVSFDGNGGNAIASVTVPEKTEITLPTPIREGYEFEGWYDGDKLVKSPYTVTAAVTLTAHWDRISSGGGASHPEAGSTSSSDRYDITKPSKVENGSIKVSDSKAEKGDTVTITVTPDEGYELDKLAVYDEDGDKIDLKDKGDGKFTFEMPKGDVEIEVSFALLEDETVKADFADVAADAWYADAVQYVYENGMMSGTSETTFSPDLTTTRGMIVTILYRLEGSPDLSNENLGYPYADVDANAYYADAVYWARQNGIVSGMSAEQFAPNNAITREQMAAILYRYAQFKGYDVSAKADLSVYTDAANVGTYATDAMAWANGAQLITGTSQATLTPAGNATRAQVATILMRFCENIAK